MSLTIAIALFVTVAMIAVFWDNRPRGKYKGPVRFETERESKLRVDKERKR